MSPIGVRSVSDQVKVLNIEQKCGFRKTGSIVPLRHARGNFDITARMKAILIRRDVYKHVAGVFKHFEADVSRFIDLSWYDQFTAVPEPETEGAGNLLEDDDETKQEVSSYSSKGPILRLCAKLAKGHLELSLCRIGNLGSLFLILVKN